MEKSSNSVIYGKQSARAETRRVLKYAWNTQFTNSQSPIKPSMGGFRLTMNAGDPLSRQGYTCSGPNALNGLVFTNMPMNKGNASYECDGSGIEESNCNTRYVYDSSNFTRFRKEQAMNRAIQPTTSNQSESESTVTPIDETGVDSATTYDM